MEKYSLGNILASRDCDSKPAVCPDFLAQNLLPIMHNIKFSKYVGKDLATSNPRNEEELLRHWHRVKGIHSSNILAYTYTNTQHYKSILQPRTAFSYKEQERVAGNATWIPRPIEKRLDTSEAPITEW